MPKLTAQQIASIKQQLPIDNHLSIIRLDIMFGDDAEANANVYCINDQFDIIWRIKPRPTNFPSDPFLYIKLTEDKQLVVRNFTGFSYEVNLTNGEIIEELGWTK